MPEYDYRRWPLTHVRPARTDEPNWRWMDLWEQENPRPSYAAAPKDWEHWDKARAKMVDRIWVAYCLPGFLVWDWPDKSVALARELLRYHVCGVCGAADDPGCTINC